MEAVRGVHANLAITALEDIANSSRMSAKPKAKEALKEIDKQVDIAVKEVVQGFFSELEERKDEIDPVFLDSIENAKRVYKDYL